MAAGPGCEPVGWAMGTVAFWAAGKVGAGLSQPLQTTDETMVTGRVTVQGPVMVRVVGW